MTSIIRGTLLGVNHTALMEPANTILHYGDIVTVHHQVSEYRTVYLSAKGYADNEVYGQETSEHSWTGREDSREFSVSNFRDFLFEVTPKLSFQFMDQLREMSKNRMNFEDEKSYATEKLRKLEELVRIEDQLNQKRVSEHRGQPITFGSEVNFRHVDSMYFLAGEKDSSATRNTGYKCILKKEIGLSSVFQLNSFYKSKKTGDIINTTNSVVIKNLFNSCALSFDPVNTVDKNHRSSRLPEDPLRPEVCHRDPHCKLHSSFYSTDVTMGWSFGKFLKNQPLGFKSINFSKGGSPIRGLDLIFLNHPELQGELCADVIYHLDAPEVYFRQYNGNNPNEANSLNSLWQIEHLGQENQGAIFHSMHNNEDVLANALTTDSFRLRNFLTGRVMIAKFVERSHIESHIYLKREVPQERSPDGPGRNVPNITESFQEEIEKPLDSHHDLSAGSVGGLEQSRSEGDGANKPSEYLTQKFNFEFVIVEEQYLRNKCLVYLQTHGNYLRYDQANLKLQRELRPNSFEVKKKTKPILNSDMEETRFPSRFSDILRSQNALIVQRLDDDKLSQIFFVRSCMPLLQEFTDCLHRGLPEGLGYSMFNNVLKLLEQIMNFLFNIDEEVVIYYEDYREDPMPYRQKILKDFRVLEVLTDIIFLSKDYMTRIDSKPSVQFWIEKISSNAYHALRYSIREYRPNELYCFQWIDFILEQIDQPKKDKTKVLDNEVAGRLFTELVDNNEKILDEKISDETIRNIVKYLVEVDSNKRYVKILRALCICDNKGVLKNQSLLTSIILGNQVVSTHFLFRIEVEEEEILATNSFYKIDRVKLKNFHEHSKLNDGGKIYSFFVEVIHLLADLCYEGYAAAVKFLQRHFDFDTMLEVLNSEEVSYELKHAFCHLFLNLWVDLPTYPKLKVDLTTIDWDKLKDMFTFPPLELDDLFKFKPIKYYISQTINYHFLSVDLSNKDSIHQLSFLNSIINLSQKMLELGFYTDVKEINSLVKGVKRVLTNSFTYTNDQSNEEVLKANNLTSEGQRDSLVRNYDSNIAFSKLRECRISICRFFKFISKIEIMLKQYRLIFRLKNIIQTSCLSQSHQSLSSPSIAAESAINLVRKVGESPLYYNGFKVNQQDIIDKIGFLINNMAREEEFIKIGNETDATKHLVSVFLSMSFENSMEVKIIALEMILGLFSSCQSLTESITKVICIERPFKEYHDVLSNIKNDLTKILIQFKTMSEISIDHLYNHVWNRLQKLTADSVDKSPSLLDNILPEPEAEFMAPGVKLDSFESQLAYDAESRISKTKQDILRGSGILELLVHFLSLTLEDHGHPEIKMEGELRASLFKFLTLALHDNEDNQFIALKKLEIFWDMFFGEESILESVFFFQALVVNNKRLLFDEVLCGKFIRLIIIHEHKNGSSMGVKRLVLLNILSAFCDYRGNPIKRNQNKIIKEFIEGGDNSLLEKLQNIRFKTVFAEFSNKLDSENYTKESTRVISLPQDIKLTMAIINLLNKCNNGDNIYVLNISQRTITLSHIMKWMMVFLPIPVKIVILYYIRNTYLGENLNLPGNELVDIVNIFNKIIADIENLKEANRAGQNELCEYMIITHDSCFEVNSRNEEYMLLFINCCQQLITLNMINEEDRQIRTPAFNTFVRLLLNTLLPLHKNLSKEIQQKTTELIITIVDQSKAQILHLDHNKMSDEIQATLYQVLRSEQVRKEEVPSVNFSSSTYEIFRKLVSSYKESKEFKDDVDNELNKLIEYVIDAEKAKAQKESADSENLKDNKHNDMNGMSVPLDTTSLATSLATYLKSAPPIILEHADKCLSIFIKILDLSKEREAKDNLIGFYARQQKILSSLDLVPILCDLIIHTKDISLVNLDFMLLQRLMDGPNPYTQSIILDYFFKPEMQPLFSTLEKLLLESLDSVLDVVEQLSLYDLNRNLRGKTNKDSLKRIHIHMEVEKFDAKAAFIVNVFKLFILLMKSNSRGREFMRKPLISESGKQTYNVTLIVFSIRILARLLKTFNPKCIKLADVILDFLLESIIGPSPDNQDEVMSTNFIDCVREILGEYSEGIDLVSTKQVRENSDYKSLVTKSIIVIKYLLEGNRQYAQSRATISGMIKASYLLTKITHDLFQYLQKSRAAGVTAVQNQTPQTPAREPKKFGTREESTPLAQRGLSMNLHYETDVSGFSKHVSLSNKRLSVPAKQPIPSPADLTIPFTLDNIKKLYWSLDLIDEDLTNIFEQFFVLKMIISTEIEEQEFYNETKGDERVAYDFLEAFSGNIEVVFENNIQKVYLEIQPLFRFMGKEEMNLVMNTVRRDTPKNKITDFLTLMPMVFDLISFKATLKKNGYFLSENLYKHLETVNYVLIVCINGMIMALFTKKLDFGGSITDPSFDENHIVMRVFVNAHLIITCARIIIFLFFESRVELMKQWRDIFEKIISKVRQNERAYDSELLLMSKKRFVDLRFQEKVQLFSKFNQLEKNSTSLPTLEYLFQSLLMVSKMGQFRSLLLYSLITLTAFFFGIFWAYSLLMLDIINFESNLQNIVKSITLNSNQFILTAVFAFLIIYMYSFLGFESFHEDFYMSAISINQIQENACRGLMQCFFTHFSFGPRSTGGIGDVIVRATFREEKRVHYFVRWFYDLMFFILINIIILNIVFGVIIDSFASLRDLKNKLQQDMQNNCFICSLPRTTFDNIPNGFHDHKHKEHFVWNYVYFLYNVRFKSRQRLMGMELYVSEQNENNIMWMPLMRSGRLAGSSEQIIDEKLKILHERLIKTRKALESGV